MPKNAKDRRDGIHTRVGRDGYYGTFTWRQNGGRPSQPHQHLLPA
jgi:hypothetical protein